MGSNGFLAGPPIGVGFFSSFATAGFAVGFYIFPLAAGFDLT
jgi:hypothetical protein